VACGGAIGAVAVAAAGHTTVPPAKAAGYSRHYQPSISQANVLAATPSTAPTATPTTPPTATPSASTGTGSTGTGSTGTGTVGGSGYHYGGNFNGGGHS
jgi:hypothetical protein